MTGSQVLAWVLVVWVAGCILLIPALIVTQAAARVWRRWRNRRITRATRQFRVAAAESRARDVDLAAFCVDLELDIAHWQRARRARTEHDQ